MECMTETMRTVRQEALGGAEVLNLTNSPIPAPNATEILVKTHAAGVNPIDWKIREYGLWLTPPFGVGWDVSGTVVAVSPGENRFKVGDEVFGLPAFPNEAAGYSEYVAGPARHFARKPSALDHVQAAALPMAALTAWQALVDGADVQPGQRVLVHAAAGGVGHLAVQIAKARGAYVIGTASAAKHDVLRELGADEVVDYTAVDFTEAVKDVDVVLDLIGGEYEDRSLRTLRPGGTYIGVINPLALDEIRAKAQALGLRGITVNVAPDHAVLEQVAALAEEGRLRPLVAGTFPLQDVREAHELSQSQRATGKIVLTF
ncbi:Narbonolide_10-deoxymethynolide synthase PikA2, modules 3 and 4 [Streptomyces sp. enrichment culture]